MIYEISKFLCFVVLKIFFKLEVKGKEFLPRNRPCIIASNHISHLDPVVVGAGCSCALHYLAKEEL
ncbi:MAG: 1-acyl-sn-glycerol-3-phosphate acyltransferase, partial [Candidatus Omnitrophota bacterium]|nr:1-acyl-sn-glycerol-3-phosphate acyltransferase [Candidatus Omnitrophota bacterium]